MGLLYLLPAKLTVMYLMYNEGTRRSPNVKHGKYCKDFQRNVTLVSVRQLQNNAIFCCLKLSEGSTCEIVLNDTDIQATNPTFFFNFFSTVVPSILI